MAKTVTWDDVEAAAEGLRAYTRLTGGRPPERLVWIYFLTKRNVEGAPQAFMDREFERFDAKFSPA